MEEGNEGVDIQANSLENLVERGQSTLVENLLTYRIVSKDVVKIPLLKAWKPMGSVSFRALGENLFLIEFEHEWDKSRVLEG